MLGDTREYGETEAAWAGDAQETESLFYLEQRFIKLVVSVLQIVATHRVIYCLMLQKISFLESLKIRLKSDIKIK